MDRIAEP